MGPPVGVRVPPLALCAALASRELFLESLGCRTLLVGAVSDDESGSRDRRCGASAVGGGGPCGRGDGRDRPRLRSAPPQGAGARLSSGTRAALGARADVRRPGARRRVRPAGVRSRTPKRCASSRSNPSASRRSSPSSAEPGAPLRYSATVEVRPTVVAAGYAGLTVERPVHDRHRRGRRSVHRAAASATTPRSMPITDRHASHSAATSPRSTTRRASDGASVGRGERRLVEVGGAPGGRTGRASRRRRDRRADRRSRSTIRPSHRIRDLAGQRVHLPRRDPALAQRECRRSTTRSPRRTPSATRVDALRERVRAAARRGGAARCRRARARGADRTAGQPRTSSMCRRR